MCIRDRFKAAGWPEARNLCLSNNEPLMRWLVDEFVSRFASFRGASGLQSMTYLKADHMTSRAEGTSFHEEQLAGGGASLALRWEDLGTPFAVDVPPAMSSTGAHQMYSVFVESEQASITVNGRRLSGQAFPRPFMGRTASSAFLAFSETWLTT
ncbi:MAG: hypothetical protein EBY25_06940 [Betaproteobacteria bacterium]|nr:hypothetical protein [Betaproteobacteria bacterium]